MAKQKNNKTTTWTDEDSFSKFVKDNRKKIIESIQRRFPSFSHEDCEDCFSDAQVEFLQKIREKNDKSPNNYNYFHKTCFYIATEVFKKKSPLGNKNYLEDKQANDQTEPDDGNTITSDNSDTENKPIIDNLLDLYKSDDPYDLFPKIIISYKYGTKIKKFITHIEKDEKCNTLIELLNKYRFKRLEQFYHKKIGYRELYLLIKSVNNEITTDMMESKSYSEENLSALKKEYAIFTNYIERLENSNINDLNKYRFYYTKLDYNKSCDKKIIQKELKSLLLFLGVLINPLQTD